MKLQSVNTSGKTNKEIESNIFDNAGSPTLVAQAVRVYLANQRSGTAKTKTRSEIARTKKKWFKQKGTGNARHGARTAPIFVGGGIAHGPRGIANWKLSMSQMMRQRALETALALQAGENNIMVIEGMESISGKTKDVMNTLNALKLVDKAVLLVVDTVSDELLHATQNVGTLLVTQAKDLNTYIVARAQKILMTPGAMETLEKKFARTEKKEVDTKPVKVAKPRTKKVAAQE